MGQLDHGIHLAEDAADGPAAQPSADRKLAVVRRPR